MGTLCGWASIDENGKATGGQKGDQTGREVRTGNWYSFGQTVVLRFKDRNKATKAAIDTPESNNDTSIVIFFSSVKYICEVLLRLHRFRLLPFCASRIDRQACLWLRPASVSVQFHAAP